LSKSLARWRGSRALAAWYNLRVAFDLHRVGLQLPTEIVRLYGLLSQLVGLDMLFTTFSDSSTYDNATLASLGLMPGTYTYSWSTPDDSFVVNIGTTPLPAALPLFAGGLGALGLFGLRSRRRVRAP
jgi:hypothetical protein